MRALDVDSIAKQYEVIYESSLLRRYDQTFQRDLDKIKLKLQELCESPVTQQMFEKAKTEKGRKYLQKDANNCFKIKSRIRSGVSTAGEKSFLIIKVFNTPTPYSAVAQYNPSEDSIVINFYLEGFISNTKINERFQIADWFKHNKSAIEGVLAHELSHMYKSRFHMRKAEPRNLVTPLQVKSGEKTKADYASFDDEKESYLAQIWQEMLSANTNNDKTYDYCLLKSPTFNEILKSFGVSSYPHKVDKDTSVLSNVDKLNNLDKEYKNLYHYFMKKTHEMWAEKGFKFNDFANQMFAHKLQQFATTLSKDIFEEFTNDEKVKVLQTDVQIPIEIFTLLDSTLKQIYLSNVPTLEHNVFSSLSQREQQDYTLQRYRKVVKQGIKNELDVILLKKNKKLYDIIMLPEIKKAKKQEQEIRNTVEKNKYYEGDVVVASKYVLPNLKDLIILGDFKCSNIGLTSLEGAPLGVVGTFDCSNNNLKTLEHAPRDISGNFDCSNNNIGNLTGSPSTVEKNFYCSNNKLKTLENGPSRVEGDYHAEGNTLESINSCKTKVKGIFFSNQFSDSEFKNRKQIKPSQDTNTPTFKQYLKR